MLGTTGVLKLFRSHRIHATDLFTHVWLIMINVGKYAIHGSYGVMFCRLKFSDGFLPNANGVGFLSDAKKPHQSQDGRTQPKTV